MALPALVLVLLMALTAVSAVATQLRCVDAAREGARAAARGEDRAVATGVVRRESPSRATVAVTGSGSDVVVTVRAQVRAAGLPLPAISVSATAHAAREPGLPS